MIANREWAGIQEGCVSFTEIVIEQIAIATGTFQFVYIYSLSHPISPSSVHPLK